MSEKSQKETIMPLLRVFVLKQESEFNVNNLVKMFKQTQQYKTYVLTDKALSVYLSETCCRLEAEQPPKIKVIDIQKTSGIPKKLRIVIR